MKVIIVEVTRAANSFGRTHLPEIRQAYDQIEKIVADAQRAGEFRDDVSAEFAAMLFYGAIEQLLTGWIFEVVPGERRGLRAGQGLVVETICGGLEPRAAAESLALEHVGGPGQDAAPGPVLHGAAKLANVLIGLVLLPL